MGGQGQDHRVVTVQGQAPGQSYDLLPPRPYTVTILRSRAQLPDNTTCPSTAPSHPASQVHCAHGSPSPVSRETLPTHQLHLVPLAAGVGWTSRDAQAAGLGLVAVVTVRWEPEGATAMRAAKTPNLATSLPLHCCMPRGGGIGHTCHRLGCPPRA